MMNSFNAFAGSDVKGPGFDPFKIYEVPARCLRHQVLRIKVLKGEKITKGWFSDAVDKPDPYVQLDIKGNPAGKKKTKTFIDETNPIWNETFTFVIDPSKENKLHVKVKDGDWLSSDNTIHAQVYTMDHFPMNQNKHIKLVFNRKSKVHIDVLRFQTDEVDMRFGLELSEGEKQFREKRLEKVRQSLEDMLHEEIQDEHVPIIGVLGSGGGFRAMVAHSGSTIGLHESGLLDSIMYTAATSGSTWYQAMMYSDTCDHDDGKMDLNKLDSTISRSIGVNRYPKGAGAQQLSFTKWDQYREKTHAKVQAGQPVTFSDLYGYALQEILFNEIPEHKMSEHQKLLTDGQMPFPLYAAINVKLDTPESIFHEHVEFSPYEVSIPKYGVSIATEDYGSMFHMGTTVKKFDEQPLSYLMGTWGSVYSLMPSISMLTNHNERKTKMKDLKTRITGTKHSEDAEGIFDGEQEISFVKSNDTGFLGGIKEKTFFQQRYGAPKIFNFMHGITPERVGFNQWSIKKGQPYSEAFEPYPPDNKQQILVDAGLIFNSPYPIFLRKQRTVDIILSFEYSERSAGCKDIFLELQKAEDWAKIHLIPFPKIDEKECSSDDIRECYVFEHKTNSNCPIICHFPLVNISFKSFKEPGVLRKTAEEIEFGNFSFFDDPKKTFGTFALVYDQTKYDRLSQCMKYNVMNNVDIVKDVIRKVIARKRASIPIKHHSKVYSRPRLSKPTNIPSIIVDSPKKARKAVADKNATFYEKLNMVVQKNLAEHKDNNTVKRNSKGIDDKEDVIDALASSRIEQYDVTQRCNMLSPRLSRSADNLLHSHSLIHGHSVIHGPHMHSVVPEVLYGGSNVPYSVHIDGAKANLPANITLNITCLHQCSSCQRCSPVDKQCSSVPTKNRNLTSTPIPDAKPQEKKQKATSADNKYVSAEKICVDALNNCVAALNNCVAAENKYVVVKNKCVAKDDTKFLSTYC